MTTRVVILPAPSITYDHLREATRNAAIKKAIDNKLDSSNPSVYGGVPILMMNGANASFPVPNGAVWTLMPFDTSVASVDVDLVFDAGNKCIIPVYDMNVTMNIRFVFDTPVGGAPFDCYVGVFEDGVLKASHADSVKLNSFFDVGFAINVNLLTGKLYEVKMQHTLGVPVNFDMTKSSWQTMRATPNPQVLLG